MTPGQLVKAMSIALEVPEETVVQHDRNLATSGLRTKGGRGRSAPEVGPLDAARLFIAILGAVRTKDSVDAVRKFEGALFRGRHAWLGSVAFPMASEKPQTGDAETLPSNHNVIEALADLIEQASRPIDNFTTFLERFSKFDVSCFWPSGEARIGSGTFFKYSPNEVAPKSTGEREGRVRELFERAPKTDERSYFASGVTQKRTAPGAAIMFLGVAFRENGPHYSNVSEAYRAGYGTGQKSQGGFRDV